MAFDIKKIKEDFPVLQKKVDGKPIIYLDNGATTQKPNQVIDAVCDFDRNEHATVRRGSYRLGERATKKYEDVRAKVAQFINAESEKDIIFTSGATQSINLAAHGFSRAFLQEGDEIIVSTMEHHANIVPWQMVRDELGVELKFVPINDDGELMMAEFAKLMTDRTKLVAITEVSNVLGTVNPVKEITDMAHDAGAKVLVDGAQSVPHMPVDVRDIGCDFLAFSSHKMYGPSGVGVLYATQEMQKAMPPYVTGGDMILHVTKEKSIFAKPPAKFEAGTPPISQVIGLGAAIDYLQAIGFDNIQKHEHDLLEYGTELLNNVEGLRIIGTAPGKAAIISFDMGNIHPHDVVTLLDQDGVCMRGGHHCAQVVMERYGVPATTRASIGIYNTREDLEILAEGLKKTRTLFK